MEKEQANLEANQNGQLKIEGTISTGYPGDGSLITQKYSPLDSKSIKINAGTAFMERRDIGLKRLTNFTNPMEIQYYVNKNMSDNFYKKWNSQKSDNYNSSIMSVVSCGRSQYICEPLRVLYGTKKKWVYNKGSVDTSEWMIEKRLLPWYAPARTNRPLIIFVPEEEYEAYTSALKIENFGRLPPLLVVGWKVSCNNNDWIGFGCSRFAALKFMKFYFYNIPKTLWMVDDNVFNVNNGNADLTLYENHVVDEKLGMCGFKGASKIDDPARQDVCDFLNNYGAIERDLAKLSDKKVGMEIAQQVVILNLPLLKENGLNYSPLFCFSGEDVSFSSFLNTCGLFKSVWSPKVIKYNPKIFNCGDGSESSPSFYSQKMGELCKNLFEYDSGLLVENTSSNGPNIWENEGTFKKYYKDERASFYKSKVHAFEQCMVQEVKTMNQEALKQYFSDTATYNINYI